MLTHPFYNAVWTIKHLNKDGKVVHEEQTRNALVDEGESLMLDVFYRNQNSPTQFYARLCNQSGLDEATTLTTITGEPAMPGDPLNTGYEPQLIERSAVGFPTLELHQGDYRVISKQVTFTASGGEIGPVSAIFLATTSGNSGKLVAFVILSMQRTLLNGDSLIASFTVKLQ